MNRWDRADVMHPLRFGRKETEGTIADGFRVLLIDRGVALVAAYHEAEETDEAFDDLGRGADALAVAARRTGRGETIDNWLLAPVRTSIELMYDEGTAERLIVALDRAFGRAPRPRRRVV
jgi:hypothetical protein